jgi:hypothetical protein
MKKETARTFITEGISFFDPEVRNFLCNLLEKVPADHWVRSRLFDRLSSLAKPWLEERSNNLSPVVGSIVEKLVDYADMVAGTLSKKETLKKAGVEPKPEPQGDGDWVPRFAKDAEERIRKADDVVAKKKIFEELKEEFQLRMALADFLAEEIKKRQEASKRAAEQAATESVNQQPQSETAEPKKTAEQFAEDLKKFFRERAQKLDAAAGKLAPHIRALNRKLLTRDQERRAKEEQCNPEYYGKKRPWYCRL